MRALHQIGRRPGRPSGFDRNDQPLLRSDPVGVGRDLLQPIAFDERRASAASWMRRTFVF